MNYVFLSPHFPPYYRLFCQRLRERGVHVFGIGDIPEEQLAADLRAALDDYYAVDSLLDDDQLHRAVGYFIYRHGRIDRLDSLNEYFLEPEARLRTDFNIPGLKADEARRIRQKTKMKKVFLEHDIPTARFASVETLPDAQVFASNVGYPVLIKRDLGGSGAIYTARDEADLFHFFSHPHQHDYIIEEFVPGHSVTFDGIVGQDGHLLYAASHFFPHAQAIESAGETPLAFFTQRTVEETLGALGTRVLEAFGFTERFFHLEFIQLDHDKPGLGKEGDLIALQVNMRAPGGMITDMMQFASDVDLYGMWADMVTYGRLTRPITEQRILCGYASRRDGLPYVYTHEQLLQKYGPHLRHHAAVPQIMAGAMGHYIYLFTAEDEDSLAQISEAIHLLNDRRKLPEQES